MTKLQHLQKAKNYLKKVALHRRKMYQRGVSGRAETVTMHKCVEGALYMSAATSFDSMMDYLKQAKNQREIELLIPSNNQAWRHELNELVREGLFLQEKVSSIQHQVSSI